MFHQVEVVICHIVDHHIHRDHHQEWVVRRQEVVMEEHIGRLRNDDVPDVCFEEGMKEE